VIQSGSQTVIQSGSEVKCNEVKCSEVK